MEEAARSDAWEHFCAHARYLLEHPAFDAMERDARLAAAVQLRAALEAAGAGREWLPAVSEALQKEIRDLPTRPQHRELLAWASEAGEAATAAVAAFLGPGSPEDRFAAFARTAHGGPADPHRTAALLAWGSAFNFAVAPHDLPIVRPPQFVKLEEILGYEGLPSSASLVEQYRHHLAFARDLGDRLRGEGVPIRDGLDVHSLILVSAQNSRGWEIAAGVGRPRETHGPYVSVCAVLGYEAPYLREWIEFHRAVGVERFFLYNNRDRETQRELLRPYVENGLVVLHDWPEVPPQLAAYNHCIEHHEDDSRWIAFIDLDEFLFSPVGTLPEVLADYESWAAVAVNRAAFGPSGHERKPPGLVIESYLMRRPAVDRSIKSIVDPKEALVCVTPHHFVYDGRLAVNEDRYPVRGPLTPRPSLARLRVNHYETKSLEEWRAKVERIQANVVGSPDPRNPISRQAVGVDRAFDFDAAATGYSLRDETILKWVPAVREALAASVR